MNNKLIKHKRLLAIIELGGYPDFTNLYKRHQLLVETTNSMRKAVKRLKQSTTDIIVAEFNYQSDFRDRTSNLETLLAVLQKKPEIKLIIFYEKEFAHQFKRVTSRFDLPYTLQFPIDESALSDAIEQCLKD
ncbi:hypothetical protein JYT31_01160 [Beggiatoa alba]|nr:hypothetical protein [Beggiatoa alba]